MKRLVGSLVMAVIVTSGAARAQSPTLTTIYSFTGQGGDDEPYSRLANVNGKLYGTTTGLNTCCGTVFALTAPASPGGAWGETVISSALLTAGSELTAGAGGVIYGTNPYGGPAGAGVVFSLTPPASPGGSWTETTLYNFTGFEDGSTPSGLAIDRNGVMYGTTKTTSVGPGGVFSLTPPSASGGAWTLASLYNFAGRDDGVTPLGTVVIDGNGVLYGVTSEGGAFGEPTGYGTVFSVTPPAVPGGVWTKMTLVNFAGGLDGAFPSGKLTISSSGVLYGTTQYGGSHRGVNHFGMGIVFSMHPPTTPGGAWRKQILHRFQGGTTDGQNPNSALELNHGVLYGTTVNSGAANCGVVFSLTPPPAGGAWTEVVTSLAGGSRGPGGCLPESGLRLGTGGVLYGTTAIGGASGVGTVFSYVP